MSVSDLESHLLAARDACQRRHFTAARDFCRRALAVNRRDVRAIMLLAEVARGMNRPDEELEHVTTAVRLHPKRPDLRYQLGRLLGTRGEYAKAMTQFDKALRIDPLLVPPVIGKAVVYELQRDHAKARALLEPLMRAHPESPDVAMVYLRLLLRADEPDRAIEVGRRVVEAGRGDPASQRETWFLLSRAYERKGDCAAAFDCAGRGNALSADRFVPDDYRRLVDDIIATFTAGRMAKLPRAEPCEVPVFIVGVPRCGSTLVEQIISSHPQAAGLGESRVMAAIRREMPIRIEAAVGYPQCVTSLTRDDVRDFSREYLDEAQRVDRAALRITDKALDNGQHLGLINLLFPAGRVIHCRRDPVDSCLSCYLNPFAPGEFAAGSDLGHLAFHYRQYARLMDHWRAVIDMPFLEIAYEDLVRDQEAVSRRLIDFCGLAWDDACLHFHETKRTNQTLSYEQVQRPMYATSVGRAGRFGALLDPLRAALASADDRCAG